MNNTTIVTGLWDINRANRPFDTYMKAFEQLLSVDKNMFLFIPSDLEEFVWKHRSRDNTAVKIFNLEDLKLMYDPFWNKTQEIRTSESWKLGTGEHGWLWDSPQLNLEWYNPIVQSKMFMLHDVTIYNPFDTEYFYWIDAGLTLTTPEGHLRDEPVIDRLHEYTSAEEFMFLSFPYKPAGEIHGFLYPDINKYAGEDIQYVCRGGLFGGHKKAISQANGEYYSLLEQTLADGYMGTEESIFSIMAHRDPYTYRRFKLEESGWVGTFTFDVINNTAQLVEIDGDAIKQRYESKKLVPNNVTKLVSTNIYMLTFNMPGQLTHTINTMNQTDGLMTHPSKFIFDNSTDEQAIHENKLIAKQHGFEYLHLGNNTGICGGRQAVAEHFHESDADYMLFFEDDMTFNTTDQEGKFCRNGFRKYIDNIYEVIHKIMYIEEFDFLKLSFTEVYFDNDKQCSWYNVPQSVRETYWPNYCSLPEIGLDPNCPKTSFGTINTVDEVSYITGDIYYGNWPMIVSKEGNRKMFIDTVFENPFESTWMSHMFQLTKEGKLNPAILLASPIWHDRIEYYKAEDRREN